jgi:hypothetical protein
MGSNPAMPAIPMEQNAITDKLARTISKFIGLLIPCNYALDDRYDLYELECQIPKGHPHLRAMPMPKWQISMKTIDYGSHRTASRVAAVALHRHRTTMDRQFPAPANEYSPGLV